MDEFSQLRYLISDNYSLCLININLASTSCIEVYCALLFSTVLRDPYLVIMFLLTELKCATGKRKKARKQACVCSIPLLFLQSINSKGWNREAGAADFILNHLAENLPLNPLVRFGFHFQTIPHHREQISSLESTENTSKSYPVNNQRAENFLAVFFFSKNSLIIISKLYRVAYSLTEMEVQVREKKKAKIK